MNDRQRRKVLNFLPHYGSPKGVTVRQAYDRALKGDQMGVTPSDINRLYNKEAHKMLDSTGKAKLGKNRSHLFTKKKGVLTIPTPPEESEKGWTNWFNETGRS